MKRRLLQMVCALLSLVLCLSLCTAAFAKEYKTLKSGDSGDSVRNLQLELKDKGYYKGDVDGKFGPSTRKAVVAFQSHYGLTADGKAGKKTLTALYEGIEAVNVIDNKRQATIEPKNPNTLCYGCKGDRVKTLQRALKNLGYYKGSVDGNFGDMTEAAVKKFQYAKKLHADGMAGTATLKALNNAQKTKVSTTFLLTVGSRGAEVRNVQVRLGQLGYDTGASDVKGYFGSNTAEALRQYQSDNGMSETGTLTSTQYTRFMKDTSPNASNDSEDA